MACTHTHPDICNTHKHREDYRRLHLHPQLGIRCSISHLLKGAISKILPPCNTKWPQCGSAGVSLGSIPMTQWLLQQVQPFLALRSVVPPLFTHPPPTCVGSETQTDGNTAGPWKTPQIQRIKKKLVMKPKRCHCFRIVELTVLTKLQRGNAKVVGWRGGCRRNEINSVTPPHHL